MELRRLDPIADEPLFHIAYYWLTDAPSWRQECEAVFGTVDREQYLTNTESAGRISIGVFDGPEFVALIGLTLRDIDIYEAHIEASPEVSKELIVSAARMVAAQMFNNYGMKMVYTLTPKFNRPVLALNKAIGFQPDNVIIAQGTCRGRLIDWMKYSLTSMELSQ